jgi:hypothetical protein
MSRHIGHNRSTPAHSEWIVAAKQRESALPPRKGKYREIFPGKFLHSSADRFRVLLIAAILLIRAAASG